jgi:hypothetical protein
MGRGVRECNARSPRPPCDLVRDPGDILALGERMACPSVAEVIGRGGFPACAGRGWLSRLSYFNTVRATELA